MNTTNKKLIIALLVILIFLMCFIPIKSNNSKYKLNIIGPYGDNEAYHPKVINFPNKWNGYKYWMSYTPYPKGEDSKENPCIAVSNDLVNWITPNELINPLYTPEKTEKGKIYNSDSHLVYNSDNNQLECYWRYVNDIEDKIIIYRIVSKDGINWSEKEVSYEGKNGKSDCISPAIIYENGIYKMWFVEEIGIIKYAESKNGLEWNNSQYITLNYPTNLKTWHLDVIKTKKGYEMLVVAFVNWNKRNDMSLYYTSSTDGINWGTATEIIKPAKKTQNWDNKGIYRASFIYEDGIYYVFYGGTDKNYHHGTGLVFGRDITKLKSTNINYSKPNAGIKFRKLVEKEKNKFK